MSTNVRLSIEVIKRVPFHRTDVELGFRFRKQSVWLIRIGDNCHRVTSYLVIYRRDNNALDSHHLGELVRLRNGRRSFPQSLSCRVPRWQLWGYLDADDLFTLHLPVS